MTKLLAIFKLARPAQWVKNIFVFAALIFSGLALDTHAIVQTLTAFAGFCLVSSAIYFINDYKDLEEDRLHPTKGARPLASGQLPSWMGVAGFVVLLLLGLGITYPLLGGLSAAILAVYAAINIAYSFGLKNQVIIDVLLIASGFVLRVLAGAVAIEKLPSTWLIVCALTLSLFLGFTKRQAELISMGENAGKHRKVLQRYSEPFLNQAISVVTASTLVCYILYTVDDSTIAVIGSRLLLLSVPFVLYGIFRYLYIVYNQNSGGDPTKEIFTDVPMLVSGGLWALFCTIAVLFGNQLTIRL